jgi:AcrR family transcriptional regulator
MANRLKRKEQITAQRREQILEAALAVFSRRGFGQATVADVAQEAGTSVGTIYNYYRDKHDLLISLIANNLTLVNFNQLLSNTDGRPTDDLIAAVIEDRLKIGLENAQKIIFLFFEIQSSAALRQQYTDQVVKPFIKKLEDMLRKKVKEGDFRHVDEEIVSRAMAGSIIGAMILYRLEGKSSPYQKAHAGEIATELTNLFLLGLKRNNRRSNTSAGYK